MLRKTIALGTVWLLGAMLCSTAGGQINVWTGNGPYGGAVAVLAVDHSNPRTIYAGTHAAGLFKSTDGGTTWASMPTNFSVISALAVDPSDHQVMYAGDPGGHLYTTTDGGSTWSTLQLDPNNSQAQYQLQCIAIDPTSTAIVYVATGTTGVFKSVDAGSTWTPSNNGLAAYSGLMVFAVSILPGPNGQRVFAATNYGVFWSDDGGANWTPGTATTSFSARTVVADPSTGTLYAGAFDGVHSSADSGVSWTAATTPATATSTNVFSLVADPLVAGTVYAGVQNGGGVWRSQDWGASWLDFSSGLTGMDVQALAVVPTGSNTFSLVAGTFYIGGVFKRANTDSSWSESDTGMGTHVNAVAVDPSNHQVIYVAATSGVYKGNRNQSGSISWSRITSGLKGGWVTALAVDPVTPQTIYAGVGRSDGGVFKSSDGGGNWTQVKQILPGASDGWLQALALAPSNPAVVYAGTTRPGNTSGVFRSMDSGSFWVGPVGQTQLANPDVVALAVSPSNPDAVYAGTNGGGVFSSVIGGDSWSAANSGLTNLAVGALAIDPINGQTIYAGTGGGGLFKSQDGTVTWSPVPGLPIGRIGAIAIAPTNTQTVYAAGGSVFQTVDAGVSWRRLPDGLPAGGAISIAIDPIDRTTIYAGTNAAGVYTITYQPPPNQSPQFVSPPTPPDGAVYSVAPGNNVQFGVSARDPDAGDAVTLSWTTPPPGASIGASGPSNPAQANFNWNPAPDQIGSFILTFTARDNSGASASTSITINVSMVNADLAITGKTASPTPSVTAGSNITYTINFVNNGPGTPGSTSVYDSTPPYTKLVSSRVVSGLGWNVINAPPVGGMGGFIWRKGSPGPGAASGETATFEIVVSVDAYTPNNTVISNTASTASIDPGTVDPAQGNNSKTVSTTVVGGATTGTITVTSPNGGESWLAGSVHSIRWTTTGIVDNVKIEYSTDQGGTWSTVVASTSNSGSRSWTLPGTLSPRALVRISAAADGSVSDVSNGVFTIAPCGYISGAVTDSSGTPIKEIWVRASTLSDVLISQAVTDAAGLYTIAGLGTGSYKVMFGAPPQPGNYLSEWYNDRDHFNTAGTVAVVEGSTTGGIDAQLRVGGTVSGRVTDEGGTGLMDVSVGVWSESGFLLYWMARSDSNGNYQIKGIPAGSYKASFVLSGYPRKYSGNVYSPESAALISVALGQDTSGIDMVMDKGGQIKGRVTDAAGNPISGIQILPYDASSNRFLGSAATTDADGNYSLVVRAGQTKVLVDTSSKPTSGLRSQFYGNHCSVDDAGVLTIVRDQITGGVDSALTAGGGTISIAVKNILGQGVPASIYLYDANYYSRMKMAASTSGNGMLDIKGLCPGEYRIQAHDSLGEYGRYDEEWYQDALSFGLATPVGVSEGGTTQVAITLNLTGVEGPEIELTQGATLLASGGTFGFGSRIINADSDSIFTIWNAGTANLVLSDLPLTAGGANADQFSIITQPVPAVPPAGSTTFTVRFRPTSPGAKTAQISIANSDGDENPYFLTLTGTGVVPQLNADLAITGMTASPSPNVEAGSNITYTINFINNGPGTPGSTSVYDSTPPHTKLVSSRVVNRTGWMVIQAPPVGGTGGFIWRKGNPGLGAAAGETAQFEIVVSVDANTPNGTVISNTASTASIDPNTTDSVPGNNAQTVTTSVGPSLPPMPPPFSYPIAPPQGACVCSLPLPHDGVPQNWFIKADNSGTLTLSLFASSSGPDSFGGKMTATLFDPDNNVLGTIGPVDFPPAPDPPSRFAENSAVRQFTTAPGAIYRLKVERLETQYASYRFETYGAIQAGMNSPGSPLFFVDPVNQGEGPRWGINVAPGEALVLRIGYPSNPPPPIPQAQIRLIDPLGVVRFEDGVPMALPRTINVENAGNAPGQWRLDTLDTSNYQLDKQSGPDRGIYLTWVTGGGTTEGWFIVSVTAAASSPGLKPIKLTFTNNTTGEVYTGTSALVSEPGLDPDGKLVFPLSGFSGQFNSGVYTVTASAPDGETGYTVTPGSVDVDLWCHKDVSLPFVIDYPPVITQVTANPGQLWPPNHKMVSIALEVAVSDDTTTPAPVCRVVSVTSNEPLNGTGDGNTAADWTFSGTGLDLSLRAERSGNLIDRIYTVEVVCRDAAGNDSLPKKVALVVPHDQGKKK